LLKIRSNDFSLLFVVVVDVVVSNRETTEVGFVTFLAQSLNRIGQNLPVLKCSKASVSILVAIRHMWR
jgi:hypothetical protein